MDASINLRNIDMYLGDTHALKSFAWHKQAAENWAILGPNGSGKSALLKLLGGHLYPLPHDEAQFDVLGINRFKPGTRLIDLKRRMGIVSPDLQKEYVPVSPGLNVVVSGFFASNGIYEDVTNEQIDIAMAAMERMGVAHLRARPIGQCSYGEARRLLIARALIHDPLLLILDEPTNGLDMYAAESFLETLEGLCDDGISMVIVTHHLYEVIRPVNRVALMSNGQIVREGDRSLLGDAEALDEVFGIRLHIEERDGRFWALPAE